MLTQNSQKFMALPFHNMIEDNKDINGINTSITKQEAQNSFFFNRAKNYGSLQPKEYQEAKKVVYSNCKFDDPVSRMQREVILKEEHITPMRQQNASDWEEGKDATNKKEKGIKKDKKGSP